MRFSVYRLSILGINPIADDLINIMSENPNLLITQIALKALVDGRRVDDLLRLATQWQEREIPEDNVGQVLECGKYLSATACWAFGHAVPTEQIVQFLSKVLFLPDSDIVEQLMASEALIRLQAPMDAYLEELKHLMERCQNIPVLMKNLVLLATSCNIPFREIYPTLPIRNVDLIVRDAVHFAFTSQSNIFTIPEPREIEHFYAKWYPDLPAELHRKHSSSGS